MILNGKCADRFKEWVGKNYDILISESYNDSVIEFLYCLPTVCEYALIIEFLDSEGIICEASEANRAWFVVVNNVAYGSLPSRTEALKAAIEKGNDLYNTKNK